MNTHDADEEEGSGDGLRRGPPPSRVLQEVRSRSLAAYYH